MPASLKKKPRLDQEPLLDKTEEELEAFLFGRASLDLGKEIIASADVDPIQPSTSTIDHLEDDQLFMIDTRPDESDGDNAKPDLTWSSPELSSSSTATAAAAAWQDDDDQELEVDLTGKNILKKLRQEESEDFISGVDYESRLRHQYQKLFPTPSWAAEAEKEVLSKESAALEDDILFQSTEKLLQDKRQSVLLSPDLLDVSRVRDANWVEMNESIIRSVNWHPNGQVLLTAGFDKTLRLFQIDGKENSKLQSVYFKDMPIYQASFTRDGSEVLCMGRRKFFYSFDLESGSVLKVPGIRGREEKSFESFFLSPCNQYIAFPGKDGEIILVSRKNKQYIGCMKMNGTVRNIDFSSDGSYLFSTGGDGEIYKWDLRTRTCVHRFADEGAIHTTALACAPNDSFLATGSDSGIVNVYSRESVSNHNNLRPQPIRAIGNLTTSIDQIKFNHDGQLMAISSRAKKDQFRLVHLPSCRVFSNWPTSSTPLGYVQCMDFSPNGGYLAVGNAKGKALLYRLMHYSSA